MYLLLFPNCSENLQQKTFNSGILQSCTFQDLTLGRLMAFLRDHSEDLKKISFLFSQSTLISPSCFKKGQRWSTEAAHSLQTEKEDGPAAGELSWPSFGELSIRSWEPDQFFTWEEFFPPQFPSLSYFPSPPPPPRSEQHFLCLFPMQTSILWRRGLNV